jgi:hypothetical protein
MPYRLYIKQRLYKIKESAIVLSKRYLDDKMDTEKTNWLMDELDRTTQEENLLNTRNNPQASMFALLYKQSEFSPYLSIFLDKVARFSYLNRAVHYRTILFIKIYLQDNLFYLRSDSILD